MPNTEAYEEYQETRGLWSRVRERVFGTDEMEEAVTESPYVDSRRRAIRLESSRGIKVAVRRNATAFNDARVAADGLKAGQQQIVNLERAGPQMAERIVDFLSGVTYALDGSVDKVGDKVYMFVPANVDVELDGGSEPQSGF